MTYSLVAKLNGRTVIFGQGNTNRTARCAGAWNAKQMGVTATKIVTSLPSKAIWFDKTTEYAEYCNREDKKLGLS